MNCPYCSAPALPWFERHLETCPAHQARIANGGRGKFAAMLDDGGNSVGCVEQECIRPARAGEETCAYHAPKQKRGADGLCPNCWERRRFPGQTYCKPCKNAKALATRHKRKLKGA